MRDLTAAQCVMAVAGNGPRRNRAAAVYGLWAVLVLSGLGCAPEAQEPAAAPGQQQAGLMGSNGLQLNGLQLNGLQLNGLQLNGLQLNGLQLNGLTPEGLSLSDFQEWFEADPALHANVMTYLVSCAVPAGQERTYTRSTTGETHRWQGDLGLAPGWSSGQAMTLLEKQLVSACLGARANKFGLHVLVSLAGLDVQGNPLRTDPGEQGYTVAEGAFFGNLADGEPVRVCNNGLSLAANQSTPRVCALPGEGGRTQCSPLEYVGSCQQYCTLDSSGRYYVDCTYNGTHYRPLTTWMHPSDVPTCGDGILHTFEQQGMPGECAADWP